MYYFIILCKNLNVSLDTFKNSLILLGFLAII